MARTVFKVSRKGCLSCRPLLNAQPVRCRMKWRRGTGKPHDQAKTFAQRLAEINAKDPELDRAINIGFPQRREGINSLKQTRHWIQNRASKEQAARHRELTISLDDVRTAWTKESGPYHQKTIAEHYGIYQDLFDDAYFYPSTNLKVFYDYDEEFVTPVFTGNKIPPAEAAVQPYVEYDADPDSYWTLIMCSPDAHLQEKNSEYLHWFVGNIPGNDLTKGETICGYIQPFPPRGTGFARYVLILFKHTDNQKIDFSQEKRPPKCYSLTERTFRMFDFYSGQQDFLTPAGFAFFQSEWDSSVQSVFHNLLDMPEPSFEFIYPAPFHPKQKRYPHKQSFNIYLDRYRDVKEIQEEVLLEKLKQMSPFQEAPKQPQYANITPVPASVPSWLKIRLKNKRIGRGQWKDFWPKS